MMTKGARIPEHQMRLPGIRLRRLADEGCPHRFGRLDGPDGCDDNEGRPCVYETFEAIKGCEVFRQILHEIEEEMGI